MNLISDCGQSLDQMVNLINMFGGRQLPNSDNPYLIKVALENFASTDIPLWTLDVVPV